MNRILPFILIAAALAIIFLYVSPTYNGAIASSKQQIQSYDKALAAADTFTQKENQLIAQRNAIASSSLDRLEAFLPDSVNNVQLILDLNSLASRSGVALSNFTVDTDAANPSSSATTGAGSISSAPQSTSLVNSLTISLTASGSYSAFRTFLLSAEQSLRPLDVVSLTLQNSNNGVYSYTVKFRIYWLHT